MGWSYSVNSDRREIIREITAGWKSEKGSSECISKTLKGNTMWSLWRSTDPSGKVLDTYILCHLLGNGGKKGDGWGYKDMCESMGPYYYSCPLAYLKAAPVVNQKWRDGVMAYHAKRQKANGIAIGDAVKLVPGCKNVDLTVYTVKPLRFKDGFGRVWKVPRKLIAEVIKGGANEGNAVVNNGLRG